MPFMYGRGALSRTLGHLGKGQIMLKDNVRVVMIAFNKETKLQETNKQLYPHHNGLRNFVHWHVPQLQYKNPDVQIVTLDGVTPNPWIQIFYDDGRRLTIDCDSRTRQEIHDLMKTVVSKSIGEDNEPVDIDREETRVAVNLANFGPDNAQQCMCEVPGHVPCPAWVKLPPEMTGKGRKKLKEQQEENAASGT